MFGNCTGTYTAEGVTKLAEALKSNSSLCELKYAYSHWPPLCLHLGLRSFLHQSVSTP